jgi:N-acetylglucosaminyl-diphospho-decaprenol L-rhamnosyltransferase
LTAAQQAPVPAPIVTVSVVSHGHDAELTHLLGDLEAQCAWWIDKLIVTHNVATTKVFKSERFSVLERTNSIQQGFGANHNAALQSATTPWVLILNPDVRLRNDFLARLLEHAQNTGADVIVPHETDAHGMVRAYLRGPITPFSLINRHLGDGDAASYMHAEAGLAWASGMCLLVRRSMFEQLKGFDPAYRMYCEDWDFCARVVLAGGRVLQAPRAHVAHAAANASRRPGRAMWWHLQSFARMWRSSVFWDYRRRYHRGPDASED